MKDKMMGRRMKPLAMPKTTIPKNVLNMTTKMYDLAMLRVMTASKVEKPPWKTLEPIWLIATVALKWRYFMAVSHDFGASTVR